MKELKELIKLIDGNKSKYLDILKPGDYNKYSQLYSLILNNPKITEHEAFHMLYKDTQDMSKFSHLKARLEKRLINSLFIMDVNKSAFDETNVAYYEAYRHWAAVKLLIQRQSYSIAIKIAEKLFKQVCKYEFNEITVSLSRDLKRYYSAGANNQKKYKFYNQKYEYYYNIYIHEMKAEEVLIRLSKIVASQTNFNYDKMSINVEQELTHLGQSSVDSFSFNKFYLLAAVYHYRLLGNNQMVNNICDEAIQFFESKPFPSENTLTNFYSNKALALINSNLLVEASQYLDTLSQRSTRGSHNWHLAKILHIYVHLHLRDYVRAREVFIIANTKSNTKRINRNTREFWKIYQAYLYFLIERKKIKPIEDPSHRFGINKFLNDVPQFSKDKQGLNVAIHIVHILFLLHQRKYNIIIDRMEPLQLYTYRYLRRDATYRSNCFIKMLVQLPKGNFVRKRVERYAERYWVKLQEAPVNVHNQQVTLEILPYEDIWDFVLEMLD